MQLFSLYIPLHPVALKWLPCHERDPKGALEPWEGVGIILFLQIFVHEDIISLMQHKLWERISAIVETKFYFKIC